MSINKYSCLFMGSICLEKFFPPFHSKPVFLFFSEMSLLYTTYGCVLFFNPLCYSMSSDGAMRPFTFNVNNERYLLFPVIVIPLLFSLTYSLFTSLLDQKGLFFFYSFIHMCTHCLGHFCSLTPVPSFSPPTLLASRQNLFCPFPNFVEE
jgi:hypothetical protein